MKTKEKIVSTLHPAVLTIDFPASALICSLERQTKTSVAEDKVTETYHVITEMKILLARYRIHKTEILVLNFVFFTAREEVVISYLVYLLTFFRSVYLIAYLPTCLSLGLT